MQTHSKFEITSELQNFSFQLILSASKLVVSYQSSYLLNFVVRPNFISSFLIGRQFYFLELQLINSREATVLLSFAFKDGQQQHCLLRNMIIECHVRSDLRKSQSNCYFKFLPAISLFCPLFDFFARYFNKNSKATNQSDLRNMHST